MTKQDFIEWAISKGWEKDKWGHLQKTIDGETRRFKLQKTSVRLEYKSRFGNWNRIYSGFYSQLYLTPDGIVRGFKR